MRIPLSWLSEYVTSPTPLSAESLHDALVSVGLEEEDVHRFEVTGPVVVGEVLEFVDEPQSNGKTIRWCQVRVAPGDAEGSIRGVVCGAHNFFVGDKVVVSLPGAVLPGGFEISARKTYGHLSDGMIASAKELGLGEDHAGILRLVEMGLDPDVGTDAKELLGLDDVAVEVNVTPDRGYAMSIRGIAREYHHATGHDFVDPVTTVTPVVAQGFEVRVDDQAPIRGVPGCEVFIARSVMGIDATAPTPPFIQSRLLLAGIRSISLPVDITNYVMLEYGQPLHGYDLDRLTGGITVRRAVAGEKLTTLDDQVRTLDAEDLLITDESGPIGMAGVMGGAQTELGDSSTNVLIEAAWFDPVSIARTARRHKLPSEASKRFQRGVDPLVAEAAAQRAVDLLVAYAGGTPGELGARLIDDAVSTMPVITFEPDSVESLVGITLPHPQIEAILTDIGCEVDTTGTRAVGSWQVTPPSWRPDLEDYPTLVEEVARIAGFDSIPSVLPPAPSGAGLTPVQQAKRRITQGLAHAGLTEVLSYPFVDSGDNARCGGVSEDRQVRVANALDPQKAVLRTSLLPGLIDIAQRNVSRGLVDLALFEAGSVFLPPETLGTADIAPGAMRPDQDTIDQMNQSLPHQPWWVSGVFIGHQRPRGVDQRSESASIADALDAARTVVALAGGQLEVEQGSHPAFHPGRVATLLVAGQPIGVAGELLPTWCVERDLPRRVAAFEIDGSQLIERVGNSPHTVDSLSAMPAATQDISVVVDRSVPAATVQAAIAEGAGELLEHIVLSDEYVGEGIPEGTRSLTFALRFRADDRTLTQAEATEAKSHGVARAAELCGARLRGE
ncbi:phenylalanyl-tRNA synthetase beta chain [Pontimonas salivibrio]|uniref:Phenylalanine--tRNA ligase beta subunit n=1 Tax=Pontimonas salivibrio TaxID=1159327 RepID=A0A2L2BR79_9MICO|nr:phenylalanine--tRNA ligase subunit beta [Pontimonas salivibrio]AVG24158.1 phenylalanyl-tRNA synthetase beta chain [Pontimonas salivibrio]